jgi:hypothetical protein
MRTTRAVAALAAASQNAAGPLHSLQQCVHWLRQINQTPVAELGPEWEDRCGTIYDCIESHMKTAIDQLDKKQDVVKLPPAAELQLLAVVRLLCTASKKLLLHVAGQKHFAAAASSSSDSAGSSSISSSNSSSSSSAGELNVVLRVLSDLLESLGMCFPPLAACTDKLIRTYTESGTLEHGTMAPQLSHMPC